MAGRGKRFRVPFRDGVGSACFAWIDSRKSLTNPGRNRPLLPDSSGLMVLLDDRQPAVTAFAEVSVARSRQV